MPGVEAPPFMDWSTHPRIKDTAHALHTGGIVAYPTESVWGLGCSPFDEAAVKKLLALKKRSVDKGLILVASDISQLAPLLRPLRDSQLYTLADSWPGPITWLVIDAEQMIPSWIKGQYQTVALRVSAHPVVQGLCRAYGGPIVSTSANPQGCQPATSQWQVRRYFGNQLDAIAPGVVGAKGKPTEIRDLATGDVVRAG